MSFDTFTPWMKEVVYKALAYCKKQYGGNGLKVEEPIASTISWRPTFFLKPTNFLIVAVEVEDFIFPESLKGAAHDISHYDFPVAVYQACSLDAYQADPRHEKVNRLRNHGFGIITVADNGIVVIQHSAIPLAQHISPDTLESKLNCLNNSLKVQFRAAHNTYLTNVGQGLQQAGQLVEGLVHSLATQAANAGLVTSGVPKQALADMIDSMYECKKFKDHRATLGAARAFIKSFRNPVSHAPKTAKQAAEKIRQCRSGFLDAIEVAGKLRTVMQALGYKVKLYTT